MQPCKVPVIQIESGTSMDTLSTCNLLQKHLSSFIVPVIMGLCFSAWHSGCIPRSAPVVRWALAICHLCSHTGYLVFGTETQHITVWQTSETGHNAKCHIICSSISRQWEDNVNCFYLLSATCKIRGKTVMTEIFLPVHLNMISF